MTLDFADALRLEGAPCLALVGAGGKTRSLYHLGRSLGTAWLTTTTHLGSWQIAPADHHLIALNGKLPCGWEAQVGQGVTLLSGPLEPAHQRLEALSPDCLLQVQRLARERRIPLLIEADGARSLLLKAPAVYEPVIPDFVDHVLVIANLQGLGRPLDQDSVHRPEIFAQLSGLLPGAPVSAEGLQRVLVAAQGGLKGIPPGARRSVLLNGAHNLSLRQTAAQMAAQLLLAYTTVMVADLPAFGPSPAEVSGPAGVEEPAMLLPGQSGEGGIYAAYERVAGILLAAGGSRRMGRPKLLLPWRSEPLVRHAARAALQAGLSPLVAVVGAEGEAVAEALRGLEVQIVANPDWEVGQSTSLRAGLAALPETIGAALFLLGDQPHTPPELIRALVQAHAVDRQAVLAPQVAGQRGNPVLLDRCTFPFLQGLQGDAGGRAIFERFPPALLPWQDASVFQDVDTPQDYERLLSADMN